MPHLLVDLVGLNLIWVFHHLVQLPNSHYSRQNWADIGTLKIHFNQTQVHEHMEQPAYCLPRFSNTFFSAPAIDRKNAVVSPGDFKSAVIFDGISGALDADGEDLVKNVKGIFAFKVKRDKGGGEATWIVDAKNGKGKVEFGGKAKPDVTFQASDSDLFDLMSGKLNPQKAFFAVS